jgi:hypothetical protein
MFSWQHTAIYFLFPAHFLVIPSWVVCPFPSELVIETKPNVRKGMSEMAISVGFLAIILAVGYLWPASTPFLKIVYLVFIAYFLSGMYRLYGLDMRSKIFDKPWLANNIFDFWNRFLIQTTRFITILFYIPIYKRVRSRLLRYPAATVPIALAVTFFVIDIVFHVSGMYDLNTLSNSTGFIFKWYLFLMSYFMLTIFWQKVIPISVQLRVNQALPGVVKGIVWAGLVWAVY